MPPEANKTFAIFDLNRVHAFMELDTTHYNK